LIIVIIRGRVNLLNHLLIAAGKDLELRRNVMIVVVIAPLQNGKDLHHDPVQVLRRDSVKVPVPEVYLPLIESAIEDVMDPVHLLMLAVIDRFHGVLLKVVPVHTAIYPVLVIHPLVLHKTANDPARLAMTITGIAPCPVIALCPVTALCLVPVKDRITALPLVPAITIAKTAEEVIAVVMIDQFLDHVQAIDLAEMTMMAIDQVETCLGLLRGQ